MENINDHMPLSPDWNQERLEKLKELFPDLFTNEGQLNIDELKKIIDPQSVTETERYEFRWFGKSAAKRNAFTPSNATLQYDETRSVNPTESENLIIEGENLEVLKLLSNSYREKIKCIYIDPPYNTGGDFVYSDNFDDEKRPYWEQTGVTENGVKIDTNNDSIGRFHSNWLDMMFSRLLIARQLLKEDGVIFISIDDNEAHNLKKLGDETFGEDNFVGQFIWKRRASSAMSDDNVSIDHEYVICYQKSNLSTFSGDKKNYKNYSNLDNDPRGPWVLGDLTVGMTASMRPNQAYDLIDPNTGNVYPYNPNRVWSFIPESMKRLIEENRVFFPSDPSKRPMQKRFQKELKSDFNPFSSIMIDKVGLNTEATRNMQDLMGGNYFDYSKPLSLIKNLIPQICNEPGDIVLDFFAGSGTTAQAILELNEIREYEIKFILVQLPESIDINSESYKAGYKKISAITIERNKRVIQKIIEQRKSITSDLFKKEVLKGLGFKVFKLTKSNFPRVEFAPDIEKTDEENIEVFKKYVAEKEAQLLNMFNRDDLITEILLKNGFNLNYKVEKQGQFTKNDIYLATDGEKKTFICLDNNLDNETVNYFKTYNNTKFICLERALDTTKKYNLKLAMGNLFRAF